MNTQDTDIVENAARAGHFATLTNALKASGMVGALKAIGPFTFFAPTDAAFGKLPSGALEALLKDRAKLSAIVNAHLMKGAVLAKDMKSGDSPSIQGMTLRIAATEEGFTVNGAQASRNEIEASNGVIHPIDTVMMPKQ